jgi:hypothetical protein
METVFSRMAVMRILSSQGLGFNVPKPGRRVNLVRPSAKTRAGKDRRCFGLMFSDFS